MTTDQKFQIKNHSSGLIRTWATPKKNIFDLLKISIYNQQYYLLNNQSFFLFLQDDHTREMQ